MAAVLKIIVITLGFYLLYVIVYAINDMHLNKRKLKTFTLLLPEKCYLFIRDKKDGQYVRGYYISDDNPTIGSSTLDLNGHDVNPKQPVIKAQLKYKSVHIPHEAVLNDLVDIKYVDETAKIIMEQNKEEDISCCCDNTNIRTYGDMNMAT